MFSPSQADVRRFFCSIYAKAQAGHALQAIETIANLWIDEHPEYHADLADVDAALAAIPTMLPDDAEVRAEVLAKVRHVAYATGEATGQRAKNLARIEALLGPVEWS